MRGEERRGEVNRGESRGEKRGEERRGEEKRSEKKGGREENQLTVSGVLCRWGRACRRRLQDFAGFGGDGVATVALLGSAYERGQRVIGIHDL